MTATVEPTAYPIAMQPGIYTEMPYETYRRIDAVNATFLKALAKLSPAHAKWQQEHPDEETPAKAFGHVYHSAIFQPEEYQRIYTVAGECTATLATGKNAGGTCGKPGLVKDPVEDEWRCGIHGKGLSLPEGVKLITAENASKITSMRAALLNNSAARSRLYGLKNARAEVVVVWEDPKSGLLCKARLDQYGANVDGWAINDLKTCGGEGEAGPEEFPKTIAERQYHIQAAFYLDGLSVALGGELVENFAFLAQETTAPFVSGVYKLHQEDISLGRNTYRSCLEVYAACKKAGVWPGYIDGEVRAIHLPRWFFERESNR